MIQNGVTKNIHMFKGENRKVSVAVSSSDNQPFIIQSAQFEVYWLKEEQNLLMLQDEGNCEIDDHVVSNMVFVEFDGSYVIKYILKIGSETIIQKVYVTVCDC